MYEGMKEIYYYPG